MSGRADALQTTLAGEHAAVYLYGLLGARTSRSGTPGLYDALRAAHTHHRARRDQLIGLLADEGVSPTPPAVAYATPPGIEHPAGIRAAALAVEQTCTTTYAALVAATVGAERGWAVTALVDASVRSLTFGGTPEPLPGV